MNGAPLQLHPGQASGMGDDTAEQTTRHTLCSLPSCPESTKGNSPLTPGPRGGEGAPHPSLAQASRLQTLPQSPTLCMTLAPSFEGLSFLFCK